MSLYPFTEAMRFGIGVLRLEPSAFWRMTPRELGAARSAFLAGRTAQMEKPTLERMMAAYPDAGRRDGRV